MIKLLTSVRAMLNPNWQCPSRLCPGAPEQQAIPTVRIAVAFGWHLWSGVTHLVVHGTSGSTSYEMIPPIRLETSGGVLSTVDMVVQRRDGPRRLREHDDDDAEK